MLRISIFIILLFCVVKLCALFIANQLKEHHVSLVYLLDLKTYIDYAIMCCVMLMVVMPISIAYAIICCPMSGAVFDLISLGDPEARNCESIQRCG